MGCIPAISRICQQTDQVGDDGANYLQFKQLGTWYFLLSGCENAYRWKEVDSNSEHSSSNQLHTIFANIHNTSYHLGSKILKTALFVLFCIRKYYLQMIIVAFK